MNRMHWITVGSLAGGLILVLVLGWQFLLKPLSLAYDEKVAAKAELENQLTITKQRAAQFEKFKAEAENVRRDLDFYSRRLDPALPAAELYTLVDGLGHSFNFTTWNFEAAKRGKSKLPGVGLDEVEIRARFATDFERLGQMLNLSVSQTRILVPDYLKLDRKVDNTGAYLDTLNADLVLKVVLSPEGGG